LLNAPGRRGKTNPVKPRLIKVVPVSIVLAVAAVLLFAQALHHLFPRFDFFERQELITYDWRVRVALRYPASMFPDFGAVYLDADDLTDFAKPPRRYIWPWPRHVHADLLQELIDEGARAVAFDVFFFDEAPDYVEERRPLPTAGTLLSSDAYFGASMRRNTNVLLAATAQLDTNGWQVSWPVPVFRTNAAGVGVTDLVVDSDGVRRRCRPFVETATNGLVWHLGIQLAARVAGLDLSRARVTGRHVVLPASNGEEAVIPLRADGCFYVDWSILSDDERLTQMRSFYLWIHHFDRQRGKVHPAFKEMFKDKFVVVGGAGVGNNVGDRGPTPVRKTDVLCSSIWNIANSVLMNRWVRRAPEALESGLILALALAAGFLNWRFRAVWATVGVLTLAVGYTVLSVWLYISDRYWLPLVLPVGGALLATHVSMVAYRAVLELIEHRRIEYMRSTVGQSHPDLIDVLAVQDTAAKVMPFLGLPPSVARMLVDQKALPTTATMRRPVSILFADVRRFTEFIDRSQARAAEQARQRNLSPAEAEQLLDTEARDALATANLYLGTIASIVREHRGTLDKYIGDAVMAFWGAPRADEQHAAACVRAAVAMQKAIRTLNQQRAAENLRRERANAERAARQEPSLPLHPILHIGMGINSGKAIAGFMGSAALMSDYTVFGADVNLASRLEALAAEDQILLSEATYRELRQHDPKLAATCLAREPTLIPGIRDPVRVYEVPVG
jgi:adenylate cyclase